MHISLYGLSQDYILDDSDENAKKFLDEMKEIFYSLGFFQSLCNDTGIECLKWLYIWAV